METPIKHIWEELIAVLLAIILKDSSVIRRYYSHKTK